MDNIAKLIEEPSPCIIDWDKVPGFNNKEGDFKTSTDHLDGIEGVSDKDQYDLYGAAFMTITDMHTPYYDRMITQDQNRPWFGQSMETTYMNNTKILNEDPVLTYKELKLSNIDSNNYESVEHFGENTQNLVFKILFAMFIMMFIYYILKQIK